MTKEPESVKELRFEPLCTLCKWSRTEDNTQEHELYTFVHEQALEGIPYGAISNNIRSYIEKREFEIKGPSKKSVWRHYENHAPLSTLASIHAAREDWVPQHGQPLVNAKVMANVSKDNFDEYDELCQLYAHFSEVRKRIYEHDDSLKVGVPNGGDAWSQNKIQSYVSMVNTQKSILSEIAKMRQGDKLISVAAKFIIEIFTKNLISKLKSEFDAFASIMRRQDVGDEVVEAFEAIASQRIGMLFVEEAGAAMDLTKKEFRLPN